MRYSMLFLLVVSGCSQLIPGLNPVPSPSKAQEVTVKLQVVDGKLVVTDGKLAVGDGTINVGSDPACPCCGLTVSCRGLCGKVGCVCSRSQNSAASTAGPATSLPQFTTQTRMVYECRSGKCGWYPVEVRVPIASERPLVSAAQTQSGIRVYTNGSPACAAMQAALRGVSGVEFQTISPNGMRGVSIVPTAIKPDGSTWSPAGGWHDGSLAEFLNWRGRP